MPRGYGHPGRAPDGLCGHDGEPRLCLSGLLRIVTTAQNILPNDCDYRIDGYLSHWRHTKLIDMMCRR